MLSVGYKSSSLPLPFFNLLRGEITLLVNLRNNTNWGSKFFFKGILNEFLLLWPLNHEDIFRLAIYIRRYEFLNLNRFSNCSIIFVKQYDSTIEIVLINNSISTFDSLNWKIKKWRHLEIIFWRLKFSFYLLYCYHFHHFIEL